MHRDILESLIRFKAPYAAAATTFEHFEIVLGSTRAGPRGPHDRARRNPRADRGKRRGQIDAHEDRGRPGIARFGQIEFHGRGIAMIHQELLPFPEMTVAENICMGAEPVGAFGWLDRAAMRRKAADLLARLGVDAPPPRLMRDLSFAEQQSVEIAKALGRRPIC